MKNVKNILWILVGFVAAFTVYGCSDDKEDTMSDTLKVAPEEVVTDGISFAWNTVAEDVSLTVTTDAEGGFKCVLADPADESWLDVGIDQNDENVVLVATRGKNTSGSDYEATIRITAGNATPVEIKVVQEHYVEGDFAITFSNGTNEDEIAFAASGNLSRNITVTTNGTELSATTEASWITSTTFEGEVLTVVVEENSSASPRDEATVAITNKEGGTATLKVTQDGKPSFNLSGEWNFTVHAFGALREVSDEDKDISGKATIELVPNGDNNVQWYTISGIYGPLITEGWDGETDLSGYDPKFLIEVEDGEIRVRHGESFFDDEEQWQYYFGWVLHDEEFSTEYSPWKGKIVVDHSEAGGNETLVFPDELFVPDGEDSELSDFWGKTTTVSYEYYQSTFFGTLRVEFYKNIKLTRAAE